MTSRKRPREYHGYYCNDCDTMHRTGTKVAHDHLYSRRNKGNVKYRNYNLRTWRAKGQKRRTTISRKPKPKTPTGWKPFRSDYHKRAYRNQDGKIISIGRLPKSSSKQWVVLTPYTRKFFNKLPDAREYQLSCMKRYKKRRTRR